MDEIILTDNGQVVLDYMQKHEELTENGVFVGKDLGELSGVKGIYPVLNSLMKKGLVELMKEPIIRDFTNSKGVTRPKEYKAYKLTSFGKEFIIQCQ